MGAALEHNLPILDGGLSPDGLLKVVGLTESDLGMVEAVVLTVEAPSDDVDDGGGGWDGSTKTSDLLFILIHFSLFYISNDTFGIHIMISPVQLCIRLQNYYKHDATQTIPTLN